MFSALHHRYNMSIRRGTGDPYTWLVPCCICNQMGKTSVVTIYTVVQDTITVLLTSVLYLYIYSYTVCVPVRYITSYLKHTILHVENIRKKNKEWVKIKAVGIFFFFCTYIMYTIPTYIYFYTEHYISSRHGVQVWNIFYTRTVGIYIGAWEGGVWYTRTRLCWLNVS